MILLNSTATRSGATIEILLACVRILAQGCRVDSEIQLRSKTHSPHHTKWVVIKRFIRREGRGDSFFTEIADAVERI